MSFNRFIKCMDPETQTSFVKMNGRRLNESDPDYYENMIDFYHHQIMQGTDTQWSLHQVAQLRLRLLERQAANPSLTG